MYISLTGFLKEDELDDSLKYDLDIPAAYEKQIIAILGWSSIESGLKGELPLSDEQAAKIFLLLNKPMPEGLEFFVGVLG